MKRVECGDEHARRTLQLVPIVVENPDSGYDEVSMPVCGRCRGRLHGYDCPQCGATYSTRDGAQYCCRRRPGESPDCPECGRRMTRVAPGFTADGQATCEFATCDACGIQWGTYTGWHYPGVDS